MSVSIEESDKCRAILLGAALGDALGWPVEFSSLPEIKNIYGPSGITIPPTPARITDDTQMTIAIARALARKPHEEIEIVMVEVVKEFISWLRSPDNNRAPGLTCIAGVKNLASDIHWQDSGIKDALGCGSAMRVAPIGFLYQLQPERLMEVAHASGIATHASALTDASAIAAAYLVKLGLEGIAPLEMIKCTISFLNNLSPEFNDKLNQVELVIDWPDEEAALSHLGQGWHGHEAVAMALYCVVKYPDDWARTVQRAANITGDSDSVACIAGGIQAARLGLNALPPEWIVNLERRNEILELADALAMHKIDR